MERYEREWEDLLAACGKKPFLAGPVRIGEDPDGTVLAVDKSKSIVSSLFGGIFGSVFVVVGLFLTRLSPPSIIGSVADHMAWGCFIVGGLLEFAVLAGIYTALTSSRRLRLQTQLRRLSFCLDNAGREISVPMAGMEVRLNREQKKSASRSGWFVLQLLHSASPDTPMLLAKAYKRDQLVPAFELLGKSLGTAQDKTLVQVHLEGGGQAFVNPDPLGSGGANSRTCKLVVRSPQLAEIKPTIGIRLFFGLFFAAGVGVSIAVAANGNFSHSWPGLLLGFPFAIVGFLGISGVFSPKPITFDLAQGVMVKQGGKMPVAELATGLPLDRLAALQMCSYYQRGTAGPRGSAGYTMYELNAVLHGQDGQRFMIMNDCNSQRLLEQAQKLAKMLKLPLIDHVGSGIANRPIANPADGC